MFGFGKNREVEKLEEFISHSLDLFDTAVAASVLLLDKDTPTPGDKYLVILLGMSDAAGQAKNLDIDITRKALRNFVSDESAFSRMMELSNDRRYFEWQVLGARALIETINDKGDPAAMMKLAEKYLE